MKITTILERLARRAGHDKQPAIDDPPRFSVDRIIEETRNQRECPCGVCGKMTLDEFYGYPCCDPYDDTGRVVSKCKWTLRDRTAP